MSEFLDQSQLSHKERELAQLTYSDLIEHDRQVGVVWKELFKTIDILGKGVVHHSKVQSILVTNGIILKQDSIDLLKKLFLKNQIDFDYIKFIKFIVN